MITQIASDIICNNSGLIQYQTLPSANRLKIQVLLNKQYINLNNFIMFHKKDSTITNKETHKTPCTSKPNNANIWVRSQTKKTMQCLCFKKPVLSVGHFHKHLECNPRDEVPQAPLRFLNKTTSVLRNKIGSDHYLQF